MDDDLLPDMPPTDTWPALDKVVLYEPEVSSKPNWFGAVLTVTGVVFYLFLITHLGAINGH